MTETEAFHTKHRPVNFETVIGQGAQIKALQTVLDQGRSQQFIFSGPGGTGKTTLARISSTFLGCDAQSIIEIDAATFSGVDKMREVTELMRYAPIGGAARACIVDEAHRLSPQAWDSLLKPIEEPSKDAYWFFCTTNAAKIPTTIRTRCSHFALKPVDDAGLQKVVARVIKRESLDVSEGVLQIIIKQANGSPRQALTNLATACEAKTAKEAAALLDAALESDATIELCRFIMSGGSWAKAMGIVARLEGENPEGVRIVVVNYLGAVLKNAKSNDAAGATLTLLDNFAAPYNGSEGMAPLLLSIGRCLLGER